MLSTDKFTLVAIIIKLVALGDLILEVVMLIIELCRLRKLKKQDVVVKDPEVKVR